MPFVSFNDITIRPALFDDYFGILEVYHLEFNRHEPCARSLGLGKPDYLPPTICQLMWNTIGLGWSLVAIDNITGVIVGIAICYVKTKEYDEFAMTDCPQIGIIQKFSNDVLRPTELLSQNDVDRLLYLEILATRSSHRGRGIASALARQCVNIARAWSVPMVASVATSFISRRMFAKLKWKSFGKEIEYKSYRTEDGQVLFDDTGEDDKATAHFSLL